MEISEDARRAEVNRDELVDSEHAEDEDETGVHVYLEKIQEEEVASVHQLGTALGRQIAPFIDDIQLVQIFNRKRQAVRSTRDVRAQQQYMHTVSIIKDKLGNKFKELTSQIEDWKMSFLHEQGTHPSPSDVPEQIAQTMRHSVLKKIAFHECKLTFN